MTSSSTFLPYGNGRPGRLAMSTYGHESTRINTPSKVVGELIRNRTEALAIVDWNDKSLCI